MFFHRHQRCSTLEQVQRIPTGTRDLELKDVDLDRLGPHFSRFARLHRLRIVRCGTSGELPREIGALRHLRSLEILHTRLRKSPDWLAELPKLQRLQLRGSDIREIPPAIGLLTRLRFLDLSVNDLFSIPKELGALKRLRYLIVADCQLSTVPNEVLALPRLKGLGLYGTNFAEDEVQRVKSSFPHAHVWPAVAVRIPRSFPESEVAASSMTGFGRNVLRFLDN